MGSIAEGFADYLKDWRPDLKTATLLAKHEGNDEEGVTAWIEAAQGHGKIFTFIETENGNALCGSFLPEPMREGQPWFSDPCGEAFLFTLRNHLGVAPTKFPKATGCAAAATSAGVHLNGYYPGMSICPGGCS